jgi:ATP-dependent Clp protease adaptor protein ClpS
MILIWPEVYPMHKPKTAPHEEIQTRGVPPYHVILENDDYHSATFVVVVLCKALGYSVDRAYQLLMQAHTSGRAIVWTGSREVAELKVDQIRTFREEPHGPLGCTIEPAPGV